MCKEIDDYDKQLFENSFKSDEKKLYQNRLNSKISLMEYYRIRIHNERINCKELDENTREIELIDEILKILENENN